MLREKDDYTEDVCSLCDCLEEIEYFGTPNSSGKRGLHRLKEVDKARVRTNYFHKACNQCPSLSQDSLCINCKHMRLRHIIQCLLLDESHAEDVVHGSSRIYQVLLNLGSIHNLEERSQYCDICRMLAAAAKQTMKQNEFVHNPQCRIKLRRNYQSNRGTIGGIECRFEMMLGLEDPGVDMPSPSRITEEPLKSTCFCDMEETLAQRDE